MYNPVRRNRELNELEELKAKARARTGWWRSAQNWASYLRREMRRQLRHDARIHIEFEVSNS